jgi:exopolysaccharide production protein ExoQ
MNPFLALVLYGIGIAGLFFLDRDKSIHTSKALWLPVIWFWIVGSRPASVWFGFSEQSVSATQYMDGSPFDRATFEVLLAAGVIVLMGRSKRTGRLLSTNWPVVIFFAFSLLSVLWSDFPDVTAKRWTKAIGDLVMVLIVVTDAEPLAALKRFFSRTGFIMLPTSVLLIKYFPNLGRYFDPWQGMPLNTGVTTNKNTLGVVTFVLALGALWQFLGLLRGRALANRRRRMLAQGTLLAFGIWVLTLADSATSVACFVLGSAVILATSIEAIRRRPAAVHALVLGLILGGSVLMSLGGEGEVVQALGRNTTLTGRTDIWAVVIPMAPNPLVGAGFETFWLGPRLEKIWQTFPNLYLNQAHDGYIEIYLNLGYVGLSLIVLIMINTYRRSVATFSYDPILGSLLLAYVLDTTIYNITEAGFRMLHPMWIFLLLAAMASGGITSAPRVESSQPRRPTADQVGRPSTSATITIGLTSVIN